MAKNEQTTPVITSEEMKTSSCAALAAADAVTGDFNPDGTVRLLNLETAAQYKCTYTYLVKIHVPGVWAGMINNVPPNVADVLIQQGHKAFVKL
jgi:hypothetical protein